LICAKHRADLQFTCSNYTIDVAEGTSNKYIPFEVLFLSVAMPPSDFATTDIDEVLHELTTDEAILLTSGVGFWYTHTVKRLVIPAIKVFIFHNVHNRLITLPSALV
jgi:hypothetical protein